MGHSSTGQSHACVCIITLFSGEETAQRGWVSCRGVGEQSLFIRRSWGELVPRQALVKVALP